MKKSFLHFLRNNRILLLVLLICAGNYSLKAQTVVQFEKRASTPANSNGQYNVKGDFQMIGNSNLVASNDPNGNSTSQTNNTNMIYVNNDSPTPGIVNSSTATLAFPSIAGVDPDCTEIVYAGLYWSGRSDNGGTGVDTFDVQPERRLTDNSNYAGYTLNITSVSDSDHGGSFGTLVTYTFTPQGSGDPVVFRFHSWYDGTRQHIVTAQVGSQPEQTLSATVYNGDGAYYEIELGPEFALGSNYVVSRLRIRKGGTNVNNEFYATIKQAFTTTLDKRKVKFKAAGDSYQDITSTSAIHYPPTDYYQMYAGYSDVTDYVKLHGLGDYTVANMALREGTGGGVGYYGSWGLVVVYKNPNMSDKSVFVFDGYDFNRSPDPDNVFVSQDLSISGFTTPPNGNVSATIGMMAGEGDLNIDGDRFAIQELNTSTYLYLDHDGNTTSSSNPSGVFDNFFNSTIKVDGNPNRNPNFSNNYGSDIHMFKLDNTGNSIITNGQSSTTFRYGTDRDTYIIYSLVFSVDNWAPEPTATIDASSSIPNNSSVEPGDSFHLQFDITNPGNEAVNNTTFVFPIPFNQEYISSSVEHWDAVLPGAQTTPVFTPAAPGQATGGTLTWDIGTLPLMDAADKNKLLASIKVNLKVTTDCLLIAAPECRGVSHNTASMSGTGNQSGNTVNLTAVTDTNVVNGCVLPVTDPFELDINFESTAVENCPDNLSPDPNDGSQSVLVYNSLDLTIPRATISDEFPSGTVFYNVDPTDPNFDSSTDEVTGDFNTPVNGSDGPNEYFAVVPNMPNGCYIKILVYRTVCWKDPVNGTGLDTHVGITLLNRAGNMNSDNWPMVRKGGHIALESNTKGFVITKLDNTQMNALTPAEGMMIYNTDENCLMLYDGSAWKCFNTPTCP